MDQIDFKIPITKPNPQTGWPPPVGCSIMHNSINRATLLRADLEADGDRLEFYKKFSKSDSIFSCSDCWNDIPSVLAKIASRCDGGTWTGMNRNHKEKSVQQKVQTVTGIAFLNK
jgi:hypothetical protein